VSQRIAKILAVLPGFTASTLMDVVNPLLSLKKKGRIDFRVVLEPYCSNTTLAWADLVVLCRNAEPKYAEILNYLSIHCIPTIYDLDDNLFDIPLDTELGRYYRAAERIEMLRRYLSQAALVRVYSFPLQQTIAAFNPNVLLMDAPLDWTLIKSHAPQSPKLPINIVYVTSRDDDRLFSIFAEALIKILTDYPNRVSMHFLGYFPDLFRGIPNVYHTKFLPNYNTYLKRFSQAGYDIGLAPLLNDEFHRSKTNNKFREYAASGVVGIYSNVEVYSQSVKDGVTGLLVSNDQEAWERALKRLIEDADLRGRIRSAAKAEVQERYSQDAFQMMWWRQIQMALEMPRQHPDVEKDKETTHDINLVESSQWITRNIRLAASRYKKSGMRQTAGILRLQLFNIWFMLKINWLGQL
jgi:glycosyltransferase involved in cell wall biosynthesis